jgi:WD40 repeat protein/transcriptional regulator with XRE-family HTH domain
MVDVSSFGRLLRQYRRARDLTQERLARLVSCALTTIKKIETDERRPSRELAERLAHVLEVPEVEIAAFLRLARGVEPDAAPRVLPLALDLRPAEIGSADMGGREVRGYTLHERLGIGGFGVVYRATQTAVARQVAVKIILPRYANQPDFVRRFEAEARYIARLEHPHIVPLYDYWREPDSAYLIMRYMRGGSLAAVLQSGALPLSQVLQIVEQIGGALAAAHQAGIVHRDIKPANILLDAEGNAYLADFGIAKAASVLEGAGITQPGAIVGSPDYLSPEQITDDPVTPRTDIYSFGVMLYELLSGEKPFRSTTPADVLRMHISSPMPRLGARRADLPAAIDAVVQRATAKATAARYASMLDLVAAARAALAGAGAPDHTGMPAGQRGRETVLLDQPALKNPYKGLRPFGEADAGDFFGRDALIVRLLERMAEGGAEHRFLAVVGPSGSGKSSVVRAGVVPALRQGGVAGSDRWFIAELTPGAHPLEELELALLQVAVRQPAGLLDQLRRDTSGLLHAAQRIQPAGSDAELLLVIDQFEEVFTLVDDEATRLHFLDSLVTAVSTPGSCVRAIVTLRADFYDRPLRYNGIGELIQQHTEVVLPLTPDELEQAIVEPARRAGATVEAAAVADIVRDVGDHPGTLPLLQYALTELFEHRDGRVLTRAAYRAGGGVRGSLARRAEAIYAVLDPVAKETARQAFLRLITLGDGVEDTRRRVQIDELYAETAPDSEGSAARARPAPSLGPSPTVDAVLDRFGQARLLTFDHDPQTRGRTVEVAHEALLRAWGRLRGWLDTSRADVRAQRLLAGAAAEWAQHDRDSGFLASGARLVQFAALLDNGSVALNDLENIYVNSSVAERDRLAAAEQERQARELAQAQTLALEQRERAEAAQRAVIAQRSAARRLRVLVAALAIFLAVAAGLSAFAFQQRGQAQASADEADQQRQQAEQNFTRSEAQRLAVEANALAQSGGSAELVALLALRSLKMMYTPQGDAALAAAAGQPLPIRTFAGHTDWLEDVAFSPDSRYVLTGSRDTTARLWDVATGTELKRFEGHTGIVFSVAFAPDGRYALTGSQDKTARLWDIATGAVIRRFGGDSKYTDKPIYTVAFAPDGQTILTGGAEKIVRIWDLETGKMLRSFGHASTVYRAVFSPDGRQVASTTNLGDVLLWDVATGAQVRVFEGHTDATRDIAFAPDGKTLLTGSFDRTARLWDVATGAELKRFAGHREFIWQVAFTPDGAYAITASQDKTVRLWDIASGEEVRRYSGHQNYVVGADVSRDGRYLVTISRDQTARLWNEQGDVELPRLVGHGEDVHMAVYSPDGRYILSASLDHTARLWDAATGRQLELFRGHGEAIHAAAFSPDGKHVATASFDHNVLIWDIALDKWVRLLSNHLGTVYGLAYSSDGRYLLTSGDDVDPVVLLWDVERGIVLHRFEGHTGGIHSIVFSPDDRYALSGSFDRTIRLWDLQTGEQARVFDMPDGVEAVAFAPDGKTFVSAGFDKVARLWNLATGKQIRAFVGHADTVKSAAFSRDGQYLVTASADNTARLWDTATGQELRRFAGHSGILNSVDIAPDNRFICTASGDRTVRQWNIDTQSAARELCGRLERDFTPEERARYGIPDDAPTCGSS